MKYLFIVQYTLGFSPLQEEIVELELSEEEKKLLDKEAEDIKKRAPDGNISINMREVDPLSGICKKIQRKFFESLEIKLRKYFKDHRQCSNEENDNKCIENLFVVGWEDALLAEGLSLFMEFPTELVAWETRAWRIFYNAYNESCSKIKWRDEYLDDFFSPIRSPNKLIQQAANMLKKGYKAKNIQPPKKRPEYTFEYNWFLYCPTEYYPSISEMQAEVEDISKVPSSNYRSTTEKQRLFEEIRNALYPDGFIDFHA